MDAEPITIAVEGSAPVSGLWREPPAASVCLVLAHGAGAGMTHKSMVAIADGLFERGVTTLRYQFPYMERGGKRVDSPPVAWATVRAATAWAKRRTTQPVFAGGRSFGGRMTSGAQADAPLEGVRGLAFFAFPLHLADKPSIDRAAHLTEVKIPMLFLQGTKDSLAELRLLRGVVEGLGASARLELLDAADHAFHVPAKSGRTDTEVLGAALDVAAAWMRRLSA